jgi:hypothetical protein
MKNFTFCYSNTPLIVAVKASYFLLSSIITSVLLLTTAFLFMDSSPSFDGIFVEGYIVTKHDVNAVAELLDSIRFLFFTVLLVFVLAVFAHLHEIKRKSIVAS